MPSTAPLQPRDADLSNCDVERVHLPGAIQPHGVLFVIDPERLTVTSVSENLEQHLGIAPLSVVGQACASVPGIGDCASLVAALRWPDVADSNPFTLDFGTGAPWEASVHRHDGRLLVECEPSSSDPSLQTATFYNRLHRSLVRLREAGTLSDLLHRTAREVSQLTGFDRVLIYSFQPDWSGAVVAEECRPDDGSIAVRSVRYLGLRFPATDIPEPARTLYAKCHLRALPTKTYVPARLVGIDDARPVDLTHAFLRSVSPVHLEYMGNMGVTAQLGISLMLDDRLWGLITCNHESGAHFLPYAARSACALLGEFVSSRIGPKLRVEVSERDVAVQRTQTKLLQRVAQTADVVEGLDGDLPSLLDVVHATGVATYFDGRLRCRGVTPSPDEILALVAWLDAAGQGAIVTASLPSLYPAALKWKDVGCGLLASPITLDERQVNVERTQGWLMWFRPEVAQTVEWGGDPGKATPTAVGEPLRPRTSFACWKQEVHLKSKAFEPEEIVATNALTDALRDVIFEVDATRRIRQDAALIQESHRRLLDQIRTNQQVEVELRRAQKLEAVGRLAAGIAHEINTPLQFIGDSVQFLQDATVELIRLADETSAASREAADYDYLQEHIPKAIARSLDGLERVTNIVRAMKTFAHPDGVTKAPADLDAALESTVEIARSEFKEVAHLTLELADLPQYDCYIGELNQVFLNLIVNAAQAIEDTLTSERTRGSIVIKTWYTETAIYISVTDDGSGIPESARESVFLPFFTTKPVGRGTGQGLAICQSIVVQKHGGSLTFDSTLGQGTTFTVRLPRQA